MPAFLAPLIMAGISTALSAYQTAHADAQRKKAQADAEKALNSRPTYQTPQELKTQLADTQSMRNAANPALLMAYQQAQQQAAGQFANAQRNATSGAEALSAGAAAQSNLQSFLPQLAQAQTAYEQANRQQYYNALQGMAEDARFKHQDQLAANADRFNYNLGLAGAANTGRNLGIQSLASIASNPFLAQYFQQKWQANNPAINTSMQPLATVHPMATQPLSTGSITAPTMYSTNIPTYNPNWFLNQNAGMYGG